MIGIFTIEREAAGLMFVASWYSPEWAIRQKFVPRKLELKTAVE